MKGTAKEILLYLTTDHRFAPLMNMSRQRLVGLRKLLYINRISPEKQEALLQSLSERMSKLKNPDSCKPFSTGLISTELNGDERDWYPKPVLLEVPEVRLVRERVLLPAVVSDHKGRLFLETTMVRQFAREECMKELNLDFVVDKIKQGRLPELDVVREVMRRKGWYMVEERYDLPSIWEVVQYDLPDD